ncbi:MAG: site-specific integrase [Firmicutes bacterium]|nr:site-specific integrase [Bacillota bacterium]
MALREAEKLGLISRNPADLVDLPKVERKVPVTLTLEEAERSLEVLQGTYLYIPALLAIATGARRGEILGLRWEDVELDKGLITITQELLRVEREYVFRQPKTRGSVRPIPIPPFVVEELRAHKLQQKKWRLAAGSAWQDTGLVCTHEDGSLINPDSLSPYFIKVMKKAGFPHITFHGLRHTHATLLLKWNVHPKKVSERLGHSSIQLTMDTYSHVMPTMQDEAVQLLEENLFRRKVRKTTPVEE